MTVVLPHDLDAEGSVLGSMMIDSRVCDALIGELEPEDFYSRDHRAIYSAIRDLFAAGKDVEVVGVVDLLKGKVNPIAVSDCVASVAMPSSGLSHALIVKEHALMRSLANVGESLVTMALGSPENVPETLSEAETMVYGVSDRYETLDVSPLAVSVGSTLDFLEKVVTDPTSINDMPTGYVELDWLLGGLMDSSFYVLAARPSVGKTALAVNIARNVAGRGKRVLFVSLEMTTQELTTRLICAEAKVSMSKVTRKNLITKDLEEMLAASEGLSKLPISIVDAGVETPAQLAAAVRRRRREVDLVIVDYLQLMHGPKSYDNKAVEVGDISRSLKLMAKRFDLPVVALSQLNREVEHRKGGPKLSDLRDSGAIEQDADAVILMHRDDDLAPTPGHYTKAYKIDVEVAKHRNGPTGRLQLDWLPEQMTFMTPLDIERRHQGFAS